jgi:hypothetical protein
MISPLTDKLEPNGYTSPHWKVLGEKLYSKYQAIKKCGEIGHQWPSFHVWSEPMSFRRPRNTFHQSVDRQCEIISDSYKKVRLFYSGGRDSHLILHHMLKNRYKLDEIAVYRRFPGIIDNTTNEFDQFNLELVLKQTLATYGTNVAVKFYDLLPEHFNYYSTRLETHYFPYTNLEFFSNGVHTLAEWFPNLLNDSWVNVLGHAMPHVEGNIFYWIDLSYNMTQPDPLALHFFVDQRNTDLAVNLAYAMHDLSKLQSDIHHRERDFLPVKDYLDFPKTGTQLDTKWNYVEEETNKHRWFLGKKDILFMANALKSDIGRQTYSRMVKFYGETEYKYHSYFQDRSIYNSWIGGVSEKHTLEDV